MDILRFFPLAVKKTAHEYAAACPACGGKDRFLIFIDANRYLCRQCGIKGDAIQFLRDFQGMDYKKAAATVGKPLVSSFPARPKVKPAAPKHTPPPEAMPPQQWSEHAAAFLAHCQKDLDDCQAMKDKCLTPSTMIACGLGWCDRDYYRERAQWGLTGDKKLLLPKGLVISTMRKNGLVGLAVRCSDARPEGRPRYWQIAGSANTPFVVGKTGLPVVILESALDACLLWQEAGDLCACVATTGSSKPLDSATAFFINKARLVLASPDFDEAGKEAWQRWKKQFPKAKLWPAANAKDIGEMHQTVPVRQWLEAALTRISHPAVEIAPESLVRVESSKPEPESMQEEKGDRIRRCLSCADWQPRQGYMHNCGLCLRTGRHMDIKAHCSA